MSDKVVELFTLEEVAEQLRVSVRTVWREIRAGRLRPLKVGNRTLITRRELQAYVDHLEQERRERAKLAS